MTPTDPGPRRRPAGGVGVVSAGPGVAGPGTAGPGNGVATGTPQLP